jgi:glutamate decarboxylase
MPTFALNFSRPGAEVVAQYYTFFRLGRAGFRAVQQAARDVAVHLAREIEAMGLFRLISRDDQVPAFAFTTNPHVTATSAACCPNWRRSRARSRPHPASTTDSSDAASRSSR